MNRSRNTLLFFFFPLLVFFISNYASAQMMDSIRLSFNQHSRFVVGFDSRNSFISNERAEVLGLKIGIEFGNKFEIGISGHLLNGRNSHFYKNYPVLSPSNTTDAVKAQLRLFYIAYYAEYIFYKSDHWKFSVPLQLGLGQSSYLYTYNNKEERKDKRMVLIYEPIISSEYRLLKWLSIKAEIGYRVMIRNNPAVQENFNSPTYAIGINISFTELCKLCFPNSKWTKRMEEK